MNASAASGRSDLTRYAWLAIAAAVVTIALKAGAWWVTGSVGLLSDAAESTVNLVAAVVALLSLRLAARPADDTHQFGHTKAEYFSAASEGAMIVVAAGFILWTAVERLIHPAPLENIGIGLGISLLATLVNGLVALVLLRVGRRERSLTLVADGRHLLTDVWTSAGVVAGVLLVGLTGVERLDPVIALLVGGNIVVTGFRLVRDSAMALMDGTMPEADNDRIVEVLRTFRTPEVDFHGLRTRVSGHRGFAEVHMLVPGAWTVGRSHDLVEEVEGALRPVLPHVTLVVHVEPREDPRSYDDYPAEVPVSPDPPARGAG